MHARFWQYLGFYWSDFDKLGLVRFWKDCLGSGHYLWVGGGANRGGHKFCVRSFRGGANFECVRFSDLHRPPPPVNNDRSLISWITSQTARGCRFLLFQHHSYEVTLSLFISTSNEKTFERENQSIRISFEVYKKMIQNISWNEVKRNSEIAQLFQYLFFQIYTFQYVLTTWV